MLTYPFLLVGDLMAVNNCGYVCTLPPGSLPRPLGHPNESLQPLHLHMISCGLAWCWGGHRAQCLSSLPSLTMCLRTPVLLPQASGWTPSLFPCVQVLDPLLEVPERAGEQLKQGEELAGERVEETLALRYSQGHLSKRPCPLSRY